MGKAISVAVSDNAINATIRGLAGEVGHYTRHFTNDEQFFLKFETPITVPALPIHHDVRIKDPDPRYIERVREVMQQIAPLMPDVLSGVRYFFDPSDIGRPAFWRPVETGQMTFAYVVRLDLRFRPAVHRVLEGGTNDRAPAFATDELLLEADLVPVSDETEQSVWVREVFSETWIGETGRGYFVQGIWIDRDVSRFLSATVTPGNHRTYPFFPITCKYRSMCLSMAEFGRDAPERYSRLLKGIFAVLAPRAREIEEALKATEYDPTLTLLQQIRSELPKSLLAPFGRFATRPYLNDRDMREFVLEITS